MFPPSSCRSMACSWQKYLLLLPSSFLLSQLSMLPWWNPSKSLKAFLPLLFYSLFFSLLRQLCMLSSTWIQTRDGEAVKNSSLKMFNTDREISSQRARIRYFLNNWCHITWISRWAAERARVNESEWGEKCFQIGKSFKTTHTTELQDWLSLHPPTTDDSISDNIFFFSFSRRPPANFFLLSSSI